MEIRDMIRTDVIIVGAGLLGCFAARHLTRYCADVIVLEKEGDVCRGISKANTGIIYTGYDHKPGSLKSKLCVQANESFDALCEELGVRFSRPGSLMIAYGPAADEVIRRKYNDGSSSGVRDIRIITGTEAEALEPALKKGITSALLSESTGTLDPWELCIAAYENAVANGAQFRFSAAVDEIRRDGQNFIVSAGDEIYIADAVINSAGLNSDKIREFTEKPLVRLYPTAADYIVIDRGSSRPVSRIIFHEGEDGKGLTVVPTVDGTTLVGPTNREADEDELSSEDMRVSETGLRSLRELCSEIIPSLDLASQIRTFGSLRPNPFYVSEEGGEIVKSSKSIRELSVMEEEGMFSLIGIKTPGLTFSNELGRIVAEKVIAYIGPKGENPDFDPSVRSIVRAGTLSVSERADLIETDPDYGDIVCSCMDVTAAEIKQAIRRGAADIEGVKMRTGACMGRCQGSRCRKKILELLEQS